MIQAPAPRPCSSCPYRRDVPSGIWATEEYEKLRDYDKETWGQPMELFQCHQNDHDSAQARLCAGWVGCHGDQLLALRLAIAYQRIDPAVMDYTTPVPLFTSGAEAADHGEAGIDAPDDAACRLIRKITRTRSDVKPR